LGFAGSYYTGGYLEAVTVGDFTGDGVLDLATAGQILPGLGNGLFQDASGQIDYASAIAAADFNADGKLDVATADQATVSVMLGRGDGTLTPPINHAAGTSPIAVAAGDFNG